MDPGWLCIWIPFGKCEWKLIGCRPWKRNGIWIWEGCQRAKESTHDTPGYQGQGGQTQSFESNLVPKISSFWFCFFPSGGSHFWDQIWFQGFWFCVNFVMIAEKLGTIFGSIFGTTFKKKTKPPWVKPPEVACFLLWVAYLQSNRFFSV